MTAPTDIAIVGMSCRFPGASSVDEFWEVLRSGRETLSSFPAPSRGPSYVPLRGALANVYGFDARFFGYSPFEAESIDPQQRLFLECAWEALEATAMPAESGSVGVFAGAGHNTYEELLRRARPPSRGYSDDFEFLLSNARDFIATRASFKLDLRGPSLNVQSACSTSLVAICLACQSLADYECDLAVAGGAAVVVPQEQGYVHQRGVVASPDGRCRAFDARAEGCGIGNGVGVVALKRLEDALAARDEIWAVVRGFALNNDGALKSGFTAPSAAGQAEVIRRAMEMARVSPDEVSYVEAHGTGTPLGDPIEIEGLRRAFLGASSSHRCAIGSVKTNIGHLDAAAGVAGLIKTVLALAHRELPASLNFESPNPKLGLEQTPFYVNAALAPWTSRGPRRAGVSSFGLGGTNAHVVLEEAPARAPSGSAQPRQLLLLSAKTSTALVRAAGDLAAHLRARPELKIADVAYTLAARRRLEHRLAITGSSRAELSASLEKLQGEDAAIGREESDDRAVVFMFPGGGAHYRGMAAELYAEQPYFRSEIDRCAELVPSGADIRVYFRPRSTEVAESPALALSALFACEYALARLFLRWGVKPAAMIGHSLGEYTAACLSGVFSPADAIALVALRGELFERNGDGAMLAVTLSERALSSFLGPRLFIAAVNAPEACVVAGRRIEVEALSAELSRRGIENRFLKIAVASHCPEVEPMLPRFAEALRRARLGRPELPFVSNVTATWCDPDEVSKPEYWLSHLTKPVRMAAGVAKLLEDRRRVFLEVGPGQSMSSIVRLNRGEGAPPAVIASLPHPQDPTGDGVFPLRALGRLFTAGVPFDALRSFEGEQRNRISLPSYPFERSDYRARPAPPAPERRSAEPRSICEWFYVPAWKPSLPPQASEVGRPGTCLAIGGEGSIGQALSQVGREVVFARAGAPLETLLRQHQSVSRVIFDASGSADAAAYHRAASALRALIAAKRRARFLIVTERALAVTGAEPIDPFAAMQAALALVAGQEEPSLESALIDLDLAARGAREAPAWIAAELEAEVLPPLIAYRGRQRFLSAVEPLSAAGVERAPARLARGGIYMITGGFGRIGARLARWLVRDFDARVVLIGRSPLDARRLELLEALGDRALAMSADCAIEADLAGVFAEVDRRFGRIDGVFHAAGLTRGPSVFRPLVEIGEAEVEAQLAAKVYGLLNLEKCLAGRTPAFRALFSSNASLLGGLGLSAYAAANIFQNAFALDRSRRGEPWTSITWDGWPHDLQDEGIDFGIQEYAVDEDEGLAALERGLSISGAPVLAVSRGDLGARHELWVRSRKIESAGPLPAPHARPELHTPYVAPRDDVEQRLAELWAELLGVERVGIHDSFFALGGHSLLATRLLARIKDQLAVHIPLRRMFEGPTVAEMATTVFAARAERTDALVPRDPELVVVPLSTAQRRIWLAAQAAAAETAYNIVFAARIRGAIDAPSLARAAAEVVARHEILRTGFELEGGEPQQRVFPRASLEVPVLDLSALDPAAREAEAGAHHRRLSLQPFDLARPPLVRALLLRFSAGEHLLVIAMHHLIADGWSIGILLTELAAAHRAVLGLEPPAPPPRIQYADYVLWERARAVPEASRAYWRALLSSPAPVLDLAPPRARETPARSPGGKHSSTLPPQLTAAVRELAAAGGATVFMVLLAALKTLLFRWTGQTDVIVGCATANRGRPELEAVMGCFVNILPLRTDLSGDPSFLELLARVRRGVLEGLEHTAAPFDEVVQEARPARDGARTPLFQIAFDYQRAPAPPAPSPGSAMELVGLESGVATFGLTCFAVETGDNTLFTVEYDARVFSEDWAARFARSYAEVLASIVADPRRTLSRVSLLAAEERRRIVVEWNATQRPYVADRTVHAVFESVAAERPQALAAVYGEERVSYAQLAERSHRLAHALLRRGIAPETIVGISAERSIDFLVAALAILHAGAAYVPLDPALPPKRAATMLAFAGCPLVILGRGAARAPFPVETLDLRGAVFAELSADPPNVAVFPQNLAYLMFTSGSTGRPKGVAVEHRGVLRLALDDQYVTIRQDDVVAQASNLAFDAATFEIWGALLNGAQLAGVPEEIATSPGALAEHLASFGVTTLFLTPAVISFIAERRPDAFRGLRNLLSGGDVCPPRAAQRILEAHPALRLVNAYGPTETVTFTSSYPVRDVSSDDVRVPIGRPLANTRIYLLDGNLEPVPIGARGELYAGGEGLARGYFGQPASTAERFVPDPFAETPGGRLYRTGDLAVHREDGNIDFLGRRDGQIKLRGFRIEVAEIESALLRVAGIEAAAVEGASSGIEHSLDAYLVASSAFDPGALRRTLAEQLPAYMIPSSFIRVAAIPLTRNGKTDWAALRALPRDGASPLRPEERSRSPVEELIASVWSAQLGLEHVGARQNFFELGGHSLLAARCVARIREALAIELTLRDFFERPTVAALAARAEVLRAGGGKARELPARNAAVGEGPLSFPQERLWFLHRLEPSSAAYNSSLLFLIEEAVDVAALDRALRELVHRHEALRTVFPERGGRPIQQVTAGKDVRLRVVDLSALSEEERRRKTARIGEEETLAPFDLLCGPVMRAVLVVFGSSGAMLIVTIHHIAFDDRSLRIFRDELNALYAGGSVPTLSLRYLDYAEWQRRWAETPEFRRGLEHWKKRLAAAPDRLSLPVDFSPATIGDRGGASTFQLPEPLSRALIDIARAHDASLFMLLLAAFYRWLHRATRQTDLVVGFDVANRPSEAADALIGFFVNVLPARLDVRRGEPFAELLRRVRAETLDAYDHRETPFEKLVEAAGTSRRSQRAPLVQVLFSLRYEDDGGRGPFRSYLPDDSAKSRWDLTLVITSAERGLSGTWIYKRDLFEPKTIERFAAEYRGVLEEVAAGKESEMTQSSRRTPSLESFVAKPIRISTAELASISAGDEEGAKLPAIARPRAPDVDLVEWARSNVSTLNAHLLDSGAVLFDGFEVKSVQEFEALARCFCPDLCPDYGDLPREVVNGNIYSATPYPKEERILFHNEGTHTARWPRRVFFYCRQPSQSGGETLLADTRRVLRELDPAIVRRLREKGVLYVRNFLFQASYLVGLDVSWQEFFGTADRASIEASCREGGVDFEWHAGGGLRTSKRAAVIGPHPVSGHEVIYHQLFTHHISCLDPSIRASVESLFDRGSLPRNVYFGDGSVIDDSIITEMREVYERNARGRPWKRGNVLMLDNLLAAHARNAYEGERRVYVALAEMISSNGPR